MQPALTLATHSCVTQDAHAHSARTRPRHGCVLTRAFSLMEAMMFSLPRASFSPNEGAARSSCVQYPSMDQDKAVSSHGPRR
jgi:hypothetical protein